MASQTDPRYLRSRAAILDAARELLLEHGPTAVTHAQVSERAGVGRATVYRHWPRSDQLLSEAMTTVPMSFFSTPTIPVRDWMRTELTKMARQLEHDAVRAVATTLANTALWDTNMDARRERFASALAERLAAALDDAEKRGEIALRTDPRSAAALAIGPLHYRSTIEHGAIDADLVEAAINAVGTWR
ncbi:transcriptional regulator, TetR family [Promicromonospora umidemergens]|uniref:TetR/AcrR family transcriptional regulator n=1 Tax=Promicromonospora umidemergens TaxID=629679 RepID=A0ABP8XJT8_9MICO|nr:TetR/AcrR family transcriptional regulator [Promicromonospora umidemergens]MCP2285681.1 transcriptional regulator, TetR family [Promicromonospora umidemergens]